MRYSSDVLTTEKTIFHGTGIKNKRPSFLVVVGLPHPPSQ
jgi:hypothetical protein